MNDRRGNLVVVSAPSGAGKTTLVSRLLTDLDEAEFSVSFTTRLQRADEREGVDYHFVTETVFREKIASNEFLEWAEVYGSFYGTDRAETEAIRARGCDILLDIDVRGADQVRKTCPEAVTIFVLPPSLAVLEQRLRSRSSDRPEAIAARLKAARREVRRYPDYDYIIINDDIEQATDLLRSIVLAERARTRLLEARVRPIIESFE